jgi:conjugative relaxase-like TrwC/TraI family protein
MLSLWKLRVGVEDYYLSQVARGLDDYYAGRGEMPGRWLGNAVSGLGLVGEVSADDLRAVLAALAPGTGQTPNGERLRTWKGRVPGFDLTFSAPKSVSVLYALADPLMRGQVVEAHETAVDEALAWLEREACFVRRGSNNRDAYRGNPEEFGTRRLRGAGFVAAGFRHRTSRAGDPQLHTHLLVANLTRGPDGRWSALDAQALYRSRRAAGAVYDAAVRHELTRRLGVGWLISQRGNGEIAGIPRRVLTLFSKRRAEIEAELERTGQSGPVAASQVTLQTRQGKSVLDGETLDARWRDEAAGVGYGPEHIDRLLAGLTPGGPPSPARRDRIVLQVKDPNTGTLVEEVTTVEGLGDQAAAALVERDSTFTRHQVTATIATVLRTPCSTATLERLTDVVLAQPQLVPLPTAPGHTAGWEQRWTSRQLLNVEADLLDMLKPEPGRFGVLDAATVEAELRSPSLASLGADQADMVRRVTTQGLGVEVVVGRAGTGKSYAMAAVRALYAAAGYRLVGVAPSALAARGLGEGARIDAFTFPRFMRHAASRLTPRHVVIVDEAGMAGTVELHRVIGAARLAGAKVILVGDHHQLPEIAAGGAFAAAVVAAGGYAAELTINRRQTEGWEISALDQLRHGDVAAAFRTYQEHGRVVLHERIDDVHAAAIDDWWHAYRAGGDAVLLAGTRAEARALNRDARTRAAVAGLLQGPVLEVGDRSFQAGDRIILTRNDGNQHDVDRHRRCRVDNGMIGVIEGIHADGGVDVRLVNGRRIRLDAGYVAAGHVDYGYAITIHKAQGVTCDEVFVVGPSGLYRQAGYVAMSRARFGSRLYATSRDAATLGERPHSTGIPLPSEPVADPEADLLHALETSHAKLLATTVAPHLAAIAAVATESALDVLWARHRHVTAVVRQLERAGHRNPTVERERLARARIHRGYLHVGGRVRALDWDNVGTVTEIADRSGSCWVHFVSEDGRHADKQMSWADTKPIDHPDPATLPAAAADYFDRAEAAIAEHAAVWDRLLADRGIEPDEPVILPAAIDQRQRQLAHRLAGDSPGWFTWWLGTRPGDPAGAQVWEDEVAALAAWRDARHLPADVPGYGPPPADPQLVERWREHMQRSLDVRRWLHAHQPGLEPEPIVALDVAGIRRRIEELDAILATAPADQSRILHALQSGELRAGDVHLALSDALGTQDARRDWILEHWPQVVERFELTRLSLRHGPLDHWSVPLDPAAQQLLDQLAATTADTPESRTLAELDNQLAAADPGHHARRLQHRLAQLDHTIGDLDAERHDLAEHSDRVANLDDHLTELHRRRASLADQLARHNAKATLWASGHRPRPLVDAVNRRSQHLAHRAIVDREPWVTESVRAWHATHPDDSDVAHLQRLIVELAAYRERSGHTGPEPLGPEPAADTPGHSTWQRLRDQLETLGSPADVTLRH